MIITNQEVYLVIRSVERQLTETNVYPPLRTITQNGRQVIN